MTLLEDLIALLVTEGVGTAGTDLFGGGEFDGGGAAEDQVVLYEYTGDAPHHVLGPANPPTSVFHRVQAMTRWREYVPGMEKAYEVHAVFANLTETTIGGRRFLRVEASQEPFSLGRDEQGRWRIACNYRLQAEPVA